MSRSAMHRNKREQWDYIDTTKQEQSTQNLITPKENTTIAEKPDNSVDFESSRPVNILGLFLGLFANLFAVGLPIAAGIRYLRNRYKKKEEARNKANNDIENAPESPENAPESPSAPSMDIEEEILKLNKDNDELNSQNHTPESSPMISVEDKPSKKQKTNKKQTKAYEIKSKSNIYDKSKTKLLKDNTRETTFELPKSITVEALMHAEDESRGGTDRNRMGKNELKFLRKIEDDLETLKDQSSESRASRLSSVFDDKMELIIKAESELDQIKNKLSKSDYDFGDRMKLLIEMQNKIDETRKQLLEIEKNQKLYDEIHKKNESSEEARPLIKKDDESERSGDESERSGDESERSGDESERSGDESERSGDDVSPKTPEFYRKYDEYGGLIKELEARYYDNLPHIQILPKEEAEIVKKIEKEFDKKDEEQKTHGRKKAFSLSTAPKDTPLKKAKKISSLDDGGSRKRALSEQPTSSKKHTTTTAKQRLSKKDLFDKDLGSSSSDEEKETKPPSLLHKTEISPNNSEIGITKF